MCFGPLKYMSGLGLASQAVKKGGAMAAISPAYAIGKSMFGGKDKKPNTPSTLNPYGG